jgi:hypothetical protein
VTDYIDFNPQKSEDSGRSQRRISNPISEWEIDHMVRGIGTQQANPFSYSSTAFPDASVIERELLFRYQSHIFTSVVSPICNSVGVMHVVLAG